MKRKVGQCLACAAWAVRGGAGGGDTRLVRKESVLLCAA